MSDDTFPVTWEDPADSEFTWEWDDMHTPGVLAPLAADYTRVITSGMNYRYERFGVPWRIRSRIINGYAYFADGPLAPGTDRARVEEQLKESGRRQARIVRRFWQEEVLPELRAAYMRMREAPVETAPLAEVADLWEMSWAGLRRLWGLHFMTNAGSYQTLNELADLYESLFPEASPAEPFRLVQGQRNELQQVQRDLYLLTEQARGGTAVAELIKQDPRAAVRELPGVAGGPEFLREFQRFLDAHGHLGQPYDDLTFGSWGDDPALVLVEVRKRLLHPEEDPERQRQRLAAEAGVLAGQVRTRLRARPEDLRRFEEALAQAHEAGPLTEGHNYWLDRMLQAHLHRFAVRVGRRLAAADALAQPRDIFFLHADEITRALRQSPDLRATAAQRQADHARWQKVRPPRTLGKPPEPPAGPNRFEPPPPVQTDDRKLRGVAASPGKVRGPARVVSSPDDFARVQPGDVLVCPSSNPSWVPLFGIIAALVTNTGGALSHAAVVAREFGVPAVVGTGEATERLRDGHMIEVDGNLGEVRLL